MKELSKIRSAVAPSATLAVIPFSPSIEATTAEVMKALEA